MLKEHGQELVWELLKPRIAQGQIEVSDGKQSARAKVSKVELENGVLTVTAKFTADQANFDWKTSRVLDKSGGIIDEEHRDMGRKAAGAVWTAAIAMDWKA